MSGMPRVRCSNIKTALLIYYSYSEIGNAQIKELFGERISPSTIVRLKELAREQMRIDDKPAFYPTCVNTKSAYKAWGIDIDAAESDYKHLQKLKLINTT